MIIISSTQNTKRHVATDHIPMNYTHAHMRSHTFDEREITKSRWCQIFQICIFRIKCDVSGPRRNRKRYHDWIQTQVKPKIRWRSAWNWDTTSSSEGKLALAATSINSAMYHCRWRRLHIAPRQVAAIYNAHTHTRRHHLGQQVFRWCCKKADDRMVIVVNGERTKGVCVRSDDDDDGDDAEVEL